MKLLCPVAVLALVGVGTLWGSTAALADSAPSDAAHMCLQGPQIDYYRVVSTETSAPDLEFGGLVHGADERGTFVVAQNHGECVSFVAKNKKGKGSQPEVYLQLTLTAPLISGY
jgi:hypothetical protein